MPDQSGPYRKWDPNQKAPNGIKGLGIHDCTGPDDPNSFETTVISGTFASCAISDYLEITPNPETREVTLTMKWPNSPPETFFVPFRADEIIWGQETVTVSHSNFEITLYHTDADKELQRLESTDDRDWKPGDVTQWNPGEHKEWKPDQDDEHDGDVYALC